MSVFQEYGVFANAFFSGTNKTKNKQYNQKTRQKTMPSSSFGNVFFDRTNSSTYYDERNRLSNNGCPRDRIRQHFWNLATDKTVLVDEVTTIPTSTMMMMMMTMMTSPTKSRTRRRRKQQQYHYHHHKESTRLPFTFAPSSLLQNMLNVYDDDKETGVVVVYSRSGLGKTISARLVLNQACRGMMVGGHARSDGIYWKLVANSLGILQQPQPQESTCQQPILVQQSTLLQLRKKEMLLVEQFQTWVPIWMEQIVMTMTTTTTTSHYSKQQQEPIPPFQQEGGTEGTTTTKLWGYLTEACFSPRCWIDENEENNNENDDDNDDDDDDKSTDLDDDLLLLPQEFDYGDGGGSSSPMMMTMTGTNNKNNNNKRPVLILDDFNKVSQEDFNFITVIYDWADYYNLLVFVLTSDEKIANQLLKLNHWRKLRPLRGSYNDYNGGCFSNHKNTTKEQQDTITTTGAGRVELPDGTLDDPEWIPMNWSHWQLQRLLECHGYTKEEIHQVNPKSEQNPYDVLIAAAKLRKAGGGGVVQQQQQQKRSILHHHQHPHTTTTTTTTGVVPMKQINLL